MILGHQKQWRFLTNSHKLGRLSHAYLFYGPELLGKKTFAVEFVKFLNCESKGADKPCQTCRSCQDIDKRIHPDFIFIEPEAPVSDKKNNYRAKKTTGKKDIKIDQIRKLEYSFSLSHAIAPFKAAIIDQAHYMRSDAQNSFLKLLEEPRDNTIFILIAEHSEMLLPTIVSRVQKIKFFPVNKLDLADYLKKEKVSAEKSEDILNFSSGKPGQTFNFLNDPEKLENIKEKIKELEELKRSDLSVRFQYASELSKEPQEIKNVLDIWQRYFRGVLLLKTQKNFLNQADPSSAKLRNILDLIQRVNFLISNTNVSPKLALETLMLEI